MTRVAMLGILGVLAGLTLSCAGSNSTELHCPRDPATGMSQCTVSSSSPGYAAGVTGVAAAAFAAKGCTINGCQLPDTCNPKTKRCEAIHCSESLACPAGYNCDLRSTLCR